MFFVTHAVFALVTVAAAYRSSQFDFVVINKRECNFYTGLDLINGNTTHHVADSAQVITVQYDLTRTVTV